MLQSNVLPFSAWQKYLFLVCLRKFMQPSSSSEANTSHSTNFSHPQLKPDKSIPLHRVRLPYILTFWHWSSKFNSNKSPTSCNNFSVYYPDVCLQLKMFRAFSRLSSGAQWLQWQPLVLPSYRGDSRAVFVVETCWAVNKRQDNKLKIVGSGWRFIWIVRWCTDVQTLNFTFKF